MYNKYNIFSIIITNQIDVLANIFINCTIMRHKFGFTKKQTTECATLQRKVRLD